MFSTTPRPPRTGSRRAPVALVLLLGALSCGVAATPASAARSPKPTLTCDGRTGTSPLAHEVAPRNCDILYPNLSLLGGLQLQDLHWSHWGEPTATATGVSHGFHTGSSYTIQVRLTGLKRASCGRTSLWYTRLSVKSAGYGWSKPFKTDYC